MNTIPIKTFIEMIRDSFGGSKTVYTNGSCYKFADILKSMYGGEIVDVDGHCMLALDNMLYDITGEHVPHETFTIENRRLSDRQLAFYGQKFARFDIVLDAVRGAEKDLNSIVPTMLYGFGVDQACTIIAREIQMLNFGHDLDLLEQLILQQVPKDEVEILTFLTSDIQPTDLELRLEEQYKAEGYLVISVQHEGKRLKICLRGFGVSCDE